MSSVTHAVTDKNTSVINVEHVPNIGLQGRSVEGVVHDRVVNVNPNVNLRVPTTNSDNTRAFTFRNEST